MPRTSKAHAVVRASTLYVAEESATPPKDKAGGCWCSHQCSFLANGSAVFHTGRHTFQADLMDAGQGMVSVSLLDNYRVLLCLVCSSAILAAHPLEWDLAGDDVVVQDKSECWASCPRRFEF